MDLWGKKYTRRELEGYMGDLRQVADIRLATLDDGMERGTRIAEVRTGSGFDFTVLLDRAMDIGMATYNGIPLAWQSGTGASNPSRFEPSIKGWLRTFHGGLLALCGLSNAGLVDPAVDPQNGEELGLHGRIGTVPAHDIRIERAWKDDNSWTMRLTGAVDEVSLFGWRLRLERTMEFTPGQPSVMITDRVRNMGGLPAPLMVLYHCNFGWPIVSPDSEIKSPAQKTKIEPRDSVAEPGINEWHKMQKPTPGYKEQVFFHHPDLSDSLAAASIVNKTLGVGIEITFDAKTLPFMTQWKQMGYADYTIGLEPGNCLPIGRVSAREAGWLRMLAPGETDTFTLGFRVLTV